jgi:hypothetical protein
MEPIEITTDMVAGTVGRVTASSGFSRSERLRNFLEFLVRQKIEGKADQLKETVIGTEVFGRKPDYDPRTDPVVRIEAAKLRSRLAEYYSGAGLDEPVRIEIPKGGYVPHWSANQEQSAEPRRIPVRALGLSGALVLCLALAVLFAWLHEKSAAQLERATMHVRTT